MTEKFYRINNYKPDHSQFGGIINPLDFDRKTSMSEIAERIIRDRKNDEQMKKLAERRKSYVK